MYEKFHISPLHVIATFLTPKYRSTVVTDKDFKKQTDDRRDIYPKLSLIALWLLSCPATSCSSERNFSTAGFIVAHRNRLNPKTVDDLLLLKSNQDLIN